MVVQNMKNRSNFLVGSLARKLAFTLIGAVSLLTIITGSLLYIDAQQKARKTVETNADMMLEHLSSSLASPLWNVNKMAVITAAKTLMTNDAVMSLLITDEAGRIIFSEDADSEPEQLILETEIQFEGIFVGKVRFSYSNRSYREYISRFFGLSALILLVVLLTIGIITLVLVQAFFKNPLRQLTNVANRYKSGDYSAPSWEAKYSEFQPLLKILASMGLQIEQQLSKLRESKAKYRRIFDSVEDGYIIADMDGKILSVNPATVKLLKFRTSAELEGMNITKKIYADVAEHEALKLYLEQKGSVRGYLLHFKQQDGQVIIADSNIHLVLNDTNTPIAIEGTFRDVTERVQTERELKEYRNHLEELVKERTAELIDNNEQLNKEIAERKKVEEALKESENRLENFYEAAFEGIVISEKGKIKDFNNQFTKIIGYGPDELTGLDLVKLVTEEDREMVLHNIQSNSSKPYEIKAIRKDRSIIFCEVQGRKISYNEQPARVTTIQDVTERKLAEEEIKASLKEKETLLHEIHHRVKNNMTVISSLLSLQARKAEDETTKSVLQESKNRVQAMSLIHETLYSSDNLSSINIQNYFTKLVKSIFNSYGDVQRRVKYKIKTDSIAIGVKKATPLGLIVNELTTNILKYAFPENKSGEFSINLTSDIENTCELTVADNGIGFPEDLDWRNSDSLGLKLVSMIAEAQLDGTIDIETEKGTKFKIKFKLNEK
jgi:PAS domain S-box-containing protein